MKTKLLSILAALSLMLGVGLVAAPGANAAATFYCNTYQDWLNPSNSSAWIKVCTVVNGNAVQGYVELGVNSPARTMSAAYYSGGAQISYFSLINIGPGGHYSNPTIKLPSGANFQAAYGDTHGWYFGPTKTV